MLKVIYSEKATKFYKISTLLLTRVHTVKSKVKLSQNFAAFSEYMIIDMDYIIDFFFIDTDIEEGRWNS